jgi:hypothetical protein
VNAASQARREKNSVKACAPSSAALSSTSFRFASLVNLHLF